MNVVQANQNPTPQANQVGVEQRRGPAVPRRNQIANQGQCQPMNQWGGQQRPYTNNQNRNFLDNNNACTYCGQSGHRQGPACELWCKHRNERGIPIVRFNDRQERNANQQNQPPAQLNVVMLEEVVEEPQINQGTGGKPHVEHWRCDCMQCMHIEDVQENQVGDVLAVTRSKRDTGKKKAEEQDPINWGVQKEIRTGVIKELQKIQGKEEVQPIIPVLPAQEIVSLPIFQETGGKTEVTGGKTEVPRKQTEQDDMLDDLMKAKLSLTLEQVLSWVPAFRHKLLQKWESGEVLTVQEEKQNSCSPKSAVEDVDYGVPVLEVKYAGMQIHGALLDGGSGVNILPESVCRKLGITDFENAPFQVRMADQRRIQPLGIIRGKILEVSGLKFDVNFVVLRLEESEKHYPMILGRPWLRAAKVKQDWGADRIVIRKGKRKVKLMMTSKKVIPKELRPLQVETINMIPELLEDEEDEFLNNNPSVVPVFEVDVDSILKQYVYNNNNKQESKDPIQKDQQLDRDMQEVLQQDLDEEKPEETKEGVDAVIQAQKDYEEYLSKSTRVKEDELQDLNLGTQEDPKNVRISINLTGQFKEELQELLKEFKDIFAWHYTDMKGVDPRFCQHKINLKKGRIHLPCSSGNMVITNCGGSQEEW